MKELAGDESSTTLFVFMVSTFTDGVFPESCSWFSKWLSEAATDFRVSKTLLADMNFTVFGSGNSLYEENFNVAAKVLKFFQWINQSVIQPVY